MQIEFVVQRSDLEIILQELQLLELILAHLYTKTKQLQHAGLCILGGQNIDFRSTKTVWCSHMMLL